MSSGELKKSYERDAKQGFVVREIWRLGSKVGMHSSYCKFVKRGTWSKNRKAIAKNWKQKINYSNI